MKNQEQHPASPETSAIAQFGYDLRKLRQEAKLSYGAIALSSYYSKSAVWGADQGHNLPSPNLLKAFVTACGGDPDEWIARRNTLAGAEAGRGANQRQMPRSQDLPAPDPAEASTPDEYVDALKKLREWSGLSFREVAQRTEHLPKRVAPSTLCAALQRTSLPSRKLVESFLIAADLPSPEQEVWLRVWQRLKDGKSRERPSSPQTARPDQVTLEQADDQLIDRSPGSPKPSAFHLRDWVLVDGEWREAEAGRPRTPLRQRIRQELRTWSHLSMSQSVVMAILLITVILLILVAVSGPSLPIE
ncbi:hypothetical protein ACN27F_03320 [Solwaraspora sp. WMMB335]|uniref:hypothetical protein n=1 Tax=Solwaraspora sp. WMMB335 TaxID=3404118 RepID=UPI003B92DB31